MITFLEKMMRKFQVAFLGLKHIVKDSSILIQILIGMVVLVVSVWLGLSKFDLMFVSVLIVLVIVCEIINTAIERLCDLYTTQANFQIKYIKDLMAGCVLFVSVFALIMGLVIFIPYI